MKIKYFENRRIERERRAREAEWLEIAAVYWRSIKEDGGAADKVAEMFKCSKGKVMTAISYSLKFQREE